MQPLYLKADKGKIPELKRVVVAYENRIAMEETLDAALSKIFGEVRVSEETAAPLSPRLARVPKTGKDLASTAGAHYDRAMKARGRRTGPVW